MERRADTVDRDRARTDEDAHRTDRDATSHRP
jgi:hypothetical protein